jgi:3D (Asp-Asp-Asp) domain-containing protein
MNTLFKILIIATLLLLNFIIWAFIINSYQTDVFARIDWVDGPEDIKIMVTITSYSPKETCKGKCIMADGKEPVEGVSIACPREIKLGTKVVIEGHIYTCSDRTHLRYNGRYDIYKDDYSEAKDFGIKNMEITLLK